MYTNLYYHCSNGDYEYGFYNASSMYLIKEMQYNREEAIEEIRNTYHDIVANYKRQVLQNFLFALGCIEFSDFKDVELASNIVKLGINNDESEVRDLTLSLVENWSSVPELIAIIRVHDFGTADANDYRDLIVLEGEEIENRLLQSQKL